MFDITQLSANETSTVELVGGDDEPLYDDKKDLHHRWLRFDTA